MNFISLNGKVVKADDGAIACDDRGLLYGDGLFETFRLYGGAPFLFERHMERLERSAKFLGIPLPADRQKLCAWLEAVAEENDHKDGTARLTLTRGTLPKGPRPNVAQDIEPTLLIQTRPLPEDLEERQKVGIAGATLPWPLRAEGLPLQAHKTLAYTSSVLALSKVALGTEPILETTGGSLSEGATSNLFWVRQGRLYTPSLKSGCLPGIARDFVIELAVAEGIGVTQGLWPRSELAAAEEAFVTNSVMEVTPLTALDSHKIGDSGDSSSDAKLTTPGPVTRQLQKLYARAVIEQTWGDFS
jgi:branched-subunit amino acid aminotransferase/4-amino-4-deoxychorismate lyase